MSLTRFPEHLYCRTQDGYFQPSLKLATAGRPSALLLDPAKAGALFDPMQLPTRLKTAFDEIRVAAHVDFRAIDEQGNMVTRPMGRPPVTRNIPLVVSHIPGLAPNFHITSHPPSNVIFGDFLELQPYVREDLALLLQRVEPQLAAWLGQHLQSLRARMFSEEWEIVSRRVNSLLTSAVVARETVFSYRVA